MAQGSLFPSASDTLADAPSILLVPPPGRSLTPAQRTFNRLVERVEKLREKLERETRRLDASLKYHAEHLHPRLQRISALRKDLIRGLAAFLDDRVLSKKQRNLRAIFARVHGVRFEDVARDEIDQARSEMEAMFSDLGVEVDLSDLSLDTPEEEVAARMARIAAQVRERAQEPPPEEERPRSKRQQQREERARQVEEARKKGIASIYKQLARVLHPDLEPDPERRERKLAFMQELTGAYRSSDLHTLLRLELTWIEREERNLDRLTEEKLAIYNQVLREQVAELENEIDKLKYDPRYEAIVVPDGPFGMRVLHDGRARAWQIDKAIPAMEASIERLRGKAALKEVLATLRPSSIPTGWTRAPSPTPPPAGCEEHGHLAGRPPRGRSSTGRRVSTLVWRPGTLIRAHPWSTPPPAPPSRSPCSPSPPRPAATLPVRADASSP